MTTKPSARGKQEWFTREKRDLIETAKAADSFSAAVSSFRKMVELGITADADVRSALHTSGVINYARPFSNNLSGKDGRRTTFAKKIVKGHQSDVSQMSQLRDVRHGENDRK
jgi:hypothetical protein